MRRHLLSLLLIVGAMVQVVAQAPVQHSKAPHVHKYQRCATMEHLEALRAADPQFDEKVKQQYEQQLRENRNRRNQTAARPGGTLGTQNVVVIPVVVHVVGTAANQNFANDRAIQRQIDVLNMRFAGLNPDSAAIPAAFKPLFGRSKIRFRLARRSPTNQVTNGIQRRVTNQTFTAGTVNSLKQTALGGLDQWDGTRYFNIWMANFTDGLLGIATFPNMGAPNLQGVCIGIGTIDEPCNNPDPGLVGVFDKGTTLVHEVGHYFYLYHIWGDDGGACTGSDFRLGFGPLSVTCDDDTPNQAGPTSGCFNGVATDDCSPTAPGFMYQNYMDYSNDACLYMFTRNQICRAETTLDDYRASLKTSNGCDPITPINNNARVSEIVTPASRGFACGTTAVTCDPVLRPQIQIVNDGDAPLTSLVIETKIDGVTVATENWTGNLIPSEFAFVTLNSVVSPPGTHVLTIKVNNPNGQPDGVPANDSLRASYRILPVLSLPQPAESFQATTFAPLNWRIQNPDAGITWARSTAAGNPGNASARINCYAYDVAGEQDVLVSPNISTAGYDSLLIRFNMAYAKYSNNPAEWETLEVLYSEDCGTTWLPTGYRKNGNDLVTNGGALVTAAAFIPTATQWRSESVRLDLCGKGANIVIGFRVTNAYGQAVYLDNIEFVRLFHPDPNISVQQIDVPNGIYCNGTFTPKVRVANNGNSTITAFTLTYGIRGSSPSTFNWTGSLPKCAPAVEVSLPAITLPIGGYVFEASTSRPNNTDDVVPANDAKSAVFTIVGTLNAPVTENFEGTGSFPPANWAIQNFDNSRTWDSTRTGYNSRRSMVIRNFNNPLSASVDTFASSRIVVGNVDSAFVAFDYAYAPGPTYPGSTVFPVDTLEILVSTDCGLTTRSVWKKWGYQLQTINDPNLTRTAGFTPNNALEWRHEKVSILPAVANAADFQVYFVSKSNRQNNLYVDNVNIFGKRLPQRLKDQGYLIYPNPFGSSFLIHHSAVEPPVDLQSAQLFNAAGQMVWEKRYNGNADRVITVQTGSLPGGVYVLKMIYANRTVVERIVKQ